MNGSDLRLKESVRIETNTREKSWPPGSFGALLLLIALGAIFPREAAAGGFSQGYQGATATGLSGAVTGRPDMPEAGYYNPAGWALQGKWGASVGAAALIPLIFHEDPRSRERTQAEIDGAFPPHLHGFFRVGKFAGGLSLGIPYGSSLRWPEDWAGRFQITSTSLTAMEAAPSVAWRPLEWLAIGAGPRFLLARVDYGRNIDTARAGEEGQVSLKATTFSVGAQAGIWARPLDYLTFGVSWRSAVKMDFEGVARFEGIPAEMSQSAHDTTGRTTLIAPDRVAVGVAYELGVMGVISFDVEYNRWSAFDAFEVAFDSDGVSDIREERDWKDTFGMRVGIEYFAPVDGLRLRSGFAVDPSPAPQDTLTPAQPDLDRFIMSFGAGYEIGEGLHFDLAYNYIILSRTAASGSGFAGIYDGQAHAFSLGLRL